MAELERKREALSSQAEALRAKVVLRPEVSQYGQLQREVAQFLGSLGSVARVSALRESIEVGALALPVGKRVVFRIRATWCLAIEIIMISIFVLGMAQCLDLDSKTISMPYQYERVLVIRNSASCLSVGSTIADATFCG